MINFHFKLSICWNFTPALRVWNVFPTSVWLLPVLSALVAAETLESRNCTPQLTTWTQEKYLHSYR